MDREKWSDRVIFGVSNEDVISWSDGRLTLQQAQRYLTDEKFSRLLEKTIRNDVRKFSGLEE